MNYSCHLSHDCLQVFHKPVDISIDDIEMDIFDASNRIHFTKVNTMTAWPDHDLTAAPDCDPQKAPDHDLIETDINDNSSVASSGDSALYYSENSSSSGGNDDSDSVISTEFSTTDSAISSGDDSDGERDVNISIMLS